MDGKLLDTAYYTVESGSTIVTLKTTYLNSLADGKHTIEFLYTDGSTGGDHYFRISTNNGSPFTGESGNMMLFGGTMMASLLSLAATVLFVQRKKRR